MTCSAAMTAARSRRSGTSRRACRSAGCAASRVDDGSPVGGEQQADAQAGDAARSANAVRPLRRVGLLCQDFSVGGPQHASRTGSDLVMVEDSERLAYPDRNECGWDSGHSDVIETSCSSHLRAEFVRQEHNGRGVAARIAVCKVSPIPEGLMGKNPRRCDAPRRGRPDHAEGTGRVRRLGCDAGVGGTARPPTLRRPVAGRRASRPR